VRDYVFRSRAGCRGDGGLSATATAYQPLSRDPRLGKVAVLQVLKKRKEKRRLR